MTDRNGNLNKNSRSGSREDGRGAGETKYGDEQPGDYAGR